MRTAIAVGIFAFLGVAHAQTYHIRADGLGDDSSNDGLTWTTAFESIQKAISMANLGSSGATATHTFKLAETTGAQFYAPASYRGPIRRSFNITILGGIDPATDTKTGVSLVKGTGVGNGETAIQFDATTGNHGSSQTLSLDALIISDVDQGILLQAVTGLDGVRPNVTLTDSTLTCGTRGIYINYNKPYTRQGGPVSATVTNSTITAGQDSAGEAVRVRGPVPIVRISGSTLTSASADGVLITQNAPAGGTVNPGYILDVTSSNVSNCAGNGIRWIDEGSTSIYGENLSFSLNKVRLVGNTGYGFRSYTDSKQHAANDNTGRQDFSAVNCLVANNTLGGFRLESMARFGSRDHWVTGKINCTVNNCTVASNGGDGLLSTTNHPTSGTHAIHNTIFASNGDDGVDSDNRDGAGLVLQETYNNFYNNASNALLVYGAARSLNASDFTIDPPFCNQLPEVFQLVNGSTLLDGGDAAFAPADDLLGVNRGAAPTVGAFELGVDLLDARPDATPTLVLIGQTFTLSSAPFGGVPPYVTFLWTGPDIPAGQEAVEDPGVISPTSTGTHTYSLTVTDSLGNTHTDSVDVTVNPPLSVTASGTPLNPALGDVWDLAAAPQGGFPGYTFAWTGPGRFTSTDQNPVGVVPVNLGANVYTVTVTDSIGNTSQDDVTIYMAATPLTVAPAAAPPALLIGGSTDLSSTASGGSGAGYVFTWTGPAGFTSTLQNPGSVTPALGVNTYSVTVVDSYGLTTTAHVDVTVVNPVSPNPSANPPIIPQGGSTLLSAAPTGGSGTYVSFAWTGPGGFTHTSSTGPDVTVRPPNDGANVYSLTVTDDLGFSGTATVSVYPVASPLAVQAIVTSSLGGTTFNGATAAAAFGETVYLNAIVSGGTGSYSFQWTGPGGFTSTVQNPGAVVPPDRGANVYTITVTDVVAGDSVQDSVSVSVVDAINPNAVFVDRGGTGYRTSTATRADKPLDWFKLRMRGIDLSPGDRLNFAINGQVVGSLAPTGGLVLDDKGRARGQLGDAAGNVFHDCRIDYRARKRRLRVICRKGMFAGSGPVIQATSGVSPLVQVVVFIDRVPADGLIDEVAVLPVLYRVKIRTSGSGARTETGRAMRRR